MGKDRADFWFTVKLSLWCVTAGLLGMNIEGAWTASGGNVPYTLAIAGMELLAAVALVRALRQRGWQRIAGLVIFALAVWVCIQNGRFSIHQHFADTFPDRPDVLEAKASLYEKQAALIRQDPSAAETGLQLTLRRKIEDLTRVEQAQALLADDNRIREAQDWMKARDCYEGRIDGIKDRLTEQGMARCGADLAREADLLRGEIRKYEDLIASSQQGEGGALALELEAADLRGQAATAREGTDWMNRLLAALEGARSFGFWAFAPLALAASVPAEPGTSPSRRGPRLRLPFRRRPADTPPDSPEGADGETDTPPPLTPKQVAGHLGGSAAAHNRTAERRTRIPIGPVLTVDGTAPADTETEADA